MEQINGKQLKQMVISGASNIANQKKYVDSINVFPIPDGDTGANMSTTMNATVEPLNSYDGDDMKEVFGIISNEVLRSARGNSGVMIAEFFRGMSKIGGECDTMDPIKLAEAMKSGVDMAYEAVVEPVEGTLLTVARETAEHALSISSETSNIIEFLERIIERAKESLDNTPNLLPILKEAGVVDSGGMGFIIIFEGMLSALTENASSENMDESVSRKKEVPKEISTEIPFAYCTECVIEKQGMIQNIDKFRDLILTFGDSCLVVEDDKIIKIHVHTNYPNKVLEEALKLGELSNIKIDNMKFQHNRTISSS